jgi:hypothetical protein
MWVGDQRHIAAVLPLSKRPGTHFKGGRMGPRTALNNCKKYRPIRYSIPGPFNP